MKTTKHTRNKGFALITVIVVMSLLLLITLGMLSLSTSTSRIANSEYHYSVAQQNAKFAVMMALGQLQEHAGADQRITASADVLSNKLEDMDPAKRHLAMVWDTRDFRYDEPTNKQQFATAVLGSFQDPTDPQNVLTSPEESEITIVNNGSVLNEDDYVTVPTREITENDRLTGRYAFATFDNGVKSTFLLEPDYAEDQAQLANNLTLSRLATSPSNGLSLFNNPILGATDTSESGVLASMENIDLMARQPLDGSTTPSNEHFHDITDWSYGLLTDPRLSGFKRDLSTAFELSLEDFNELTYEAEDNPINEFHNTDNTNVAPYDRVDGGNIYQSNAEFYPSGLAPNLGHAYTFALNPGDSQLAGNPAVTNPYVFGPTWDLMRNFYRLYKSDHENLPWSRTINKSSESAYSARGFLPASYARYIGRNRKEDSYYHVGTGVHNSSTYQNNRNHAALEDTRQSGNKDGYNFRQSPALLPVVTRFTTGISFAWLPGSEPEGDELAAKLEPYIVMHNPYNVPIAFDSLRFIIPEEFYVSIKARLTYANGKTRRTSFGNYEARFIPNVYENYNVPTQIAAGNASGSLYMSLPYLDSGSYVMEPGEFLTLTSSPEYVDSGSGKDYHELSFGNINFVPLAVDLDPDSSGRVFFKLRDKKAKQNLTKNFVDEDGQKSRVQDIDVTIGGTVHGQTGKTNYLTSNVVIRNKANGNQEDYIYTHPSDGTNFDNSEHPFISGLSINTAGLFGESVISDRRLSSDQVDEFIQYFAVDMRMKYPTEGVAPAYDNNPRLFQLDASSYDSGSRGGPFWDISLLDLESSEVSEIGIFSSRPWGDFPGGDYSTSHAIFYEVPRAPITSLAQYQHLNANHNSVNGTKHIGNSMHHYGIDDLTRIASRRELMGRGDVNLPSRNYRNGQLYPHQKGGQILLDHAWVANHALWDRYFFSSIFWGQDAYADGSTPRYTSQAEAVDALVEKGDSPFFNSRIQYSPWLNTATDQETLIEELSNYESIAQYLAIVGAFNVNSTSQEAWESVLSGLKDKPIAYIEGKNGELEVTEGNGVPIASQALPNSDHQGSAVEDPSESWTGYRTLDEEEISSLAEAIVKQVKARGPFMSLSDFVNRQLTDETIDGYDIGKMGALQMAIEEAGLNAEFQRSPLESTDLTTASGIKRNADMNISAGDARFRRSTMLGTAKYVMQADILTSIGSSLTARSDSFTIRGYGESIDSQGKVAARAWCEVVVQRTAEYVEATDKPATIPNPNYPNGGPDNDVLFDQWVANPELEEANRTFGRKFRIINFKWLNQDEV